MIAPRRFLPSISSLLALEAVDRLGSASAAAEELSVTHSAISRQLKVLEGQLGLALVRRDGLRLSLTPAGAEYCETVRGLLRELSQASLRLKANPAGGGLDLAILPAFGMHWLAPRLRDFARAAPEVTVNLSSRLAPFDFSREDFDAAIHYGARDWQGVQYLELAREEVLPVCSPRLLRRPVDDPAQLTTLPLLHLETRPSAWEDWFAAQGVPIAAPRGMLFDQFATMAQAAVHDMGVAILPAYLAESEIASGRLVCPFGGPVTAPGRYYLVWPDRAAPRPPLQRFIAWLRSVI